MIPRFLILLLGAVMLISCSKKDLDTDLYKKPQTPGDNKSTQNTGSQSGYFSIKDIDSDVKMNQLVNFTWSENGQDRKLSDFKGKVIVLNFWATWCGPCKRELPDLSQLSKDLSGKDFKLIGISVDENPVALDNFLKSNSLSYTILHEPGRLVNKYMSVTGATDNIIPQTYVIDKNGKIVESLIGSRSKDDFLKIINKYL